LDIVVAGRCHIQQPQRSTTFQVCKTRGC